MRHSWVLSFALAAPVAVASAQITERPESFDSAGRVMLITPPLAARLRLTSPAWPVAGDYREARLYSTQDGYVIVAQVGGGAFTRYPLAPSDRDALRALVSTSMTLAGNPVGEEDADRISEPAKGAFMRNQMAASALIYAPSLAALTNDAQTGAAVYLLATGAAFFTAAQIAREMPVSRAQNHLATDGAVRGALMTSGLYYALAGERGGDDPYKLTVFAGSLGGSIAGFRAARGLTDGEAKGLTAGSTVTFLTVGGIMGAAGMFEDRCTERVDEFFRGPDCRNPNARLEMGALVAAAAAGYPLGLRYVRRAPYTATSGDLAAVFVPAALGVGAALTPVIGGDDVRSETVYGAATAGFLAGVFLGDRLLVRRFDHTTGEAALLGVGALAGALIGLVPVVAADTPDESVALGLATGGGIVGAMITENMIAPRRGTRRTASLAPGGKVGRARLQLDPGALLLAATGRPGKHAILRGSF